jgi:hypothetical protein
MTAYPTRSMPTSMAKYLVTIRNDEILIVPIKNDSFHNIICTKPIETIEGHQSNRRTSI